MGHRTRCRAWRGGYQDHRRGAKVEAVGFGIE
jgi:hypothetical protein